MIPALTGMGLSAAAGLNAYIPFLIVALIAKYTDVIVLPAAYGWMESWWAIGIGSVLLLTEVVVDRVMAVNLDETARCPLGVRCESCGAERADLRVCTAALDRIGVACLTMCPRCANSDVVPPVSVGTAVRLVMQHCGHLGITVVADRDACPDIEIFTDGLSAALAGLERAAASVREDGARR